MRLLGMVVALALLASGSATAADRFNAGGWVGRAIFTDSGRFSSCGMYSPYKSGTYLYFFITRSGRLRIGLRNRHWVMARGSRYTTNFWIDRGPAHQSVGTAITQQLFLFDVAPRGAGHVLNRLRFGRTIRIQAGGRNYAYRLSGTSLALDRLRYCARYELARERGVRLPRYGAAQSKPNWRAAKGGGTRPGRQTSSARAHLRLKATTMVANLINRAGLRNTRILDPDEIPKRMRGYDVVWTGPGTVGGLRIIAPHKDLTPERLTAAILAGDAAACKGAFKSGLKSNQINKKERAVRLFTDCQGPKGWRSLYTIFPMPKGGFVMVGQFATGDNQQLEDSDRKIVEALPAVLKR